jgi:hypothetical protein
MTISFLHIFTCVTDQTRTILSGTVVFILYLTANELENFIHVPTRTISLLHNVTFVDIPTRTVLLCTVVFVTCLTETVQTKFMYACTMCT